MCILLHGISDEKNNVAVFSIRFWIQAESSEFEVSRYNVFLFLIQTRIVCFQPNKNGKWQTKIEDTYMLQIELLVFDWPRYSKTIRTLVCVLFYFVLFYMSPTTNCVLIKLKQFALFCCCWFLACSPRARYKLEISISLTCSFFLSLSRSHYSVRLCWYNRIGHKQWPRLRARARIHIDDCIEQQQQNRM